MISINVFVFTGFLGSGKTLGAVLYAKKYQALSGCALYSNISIEGAKPFNSIEDFKKIAVESSSILLLDEAHIDLDARSFNTNHVKFFTQLSYYLRKLRCTLFITSPNFGDLDSRIRGITNILAVVSKSKDLFYYDMYDIQSGKHLRTYQMQQSEAFYVASNVYDTYAMVTPVAVPDSKQGYNEFLEQLKVISEDYYKERQAQQQAATGGVGRSEINPYEFHREEKDIETVTAY